MNNKPMVALAKEQLKRFWAIPVLSLMSYVLFVLTSVYNNAYSNATRNMIALLSMRNTFMIAATIIIPACIALSMFSYFFSGKATNAFHAFPFTKRTLFITNYCTGLVLMVVPLFIFSILLLSPVTVSYTSNSYMWNVPVPADFTFHLNDVYETVVVNTFPVVAGFFCRIVISYVFYYTIFTLACVLAGNGIIALLLCGALPFIPAGLWMLVEGIGYSFVFGFNGFIFVDFDTVLALSNHVLWSEFNISKTDSWVEVSQKIKIVSLWPYYLVYTLTTLVLIMITYFCVIKRKEERAGDSIVFTSLKNVLIFLLSMLGMIVMGVFFTDVISDNDFWFNVGVIVGFTISWYIAQMIAEKTINVVYKLKSLPVFGGIMLGIYLITLLFTRLDILGYERNVPDADQVAGVFLEHRYYLNGGAEFIEDKDIIARSVQVHKKIVSDRNQLRRKQSGKQSYHNDHFTTQNIIYQLHDGKQISREYFLSDNYKREAGLEDLMKSDPVILSGYPLLLEPHKLKNIGFNSNWNSYINESSLFDDGDSNFKGIKTVAKAEHIAELVEIIKKDIIISTLEEWDDGWNEELDEWNRIIWLDGSLRAKDDFKSILIGRQFELSVNTLSWLEEHGYAKEGFLAEVERQIDRGRD